MERKISRSRPRSIGGGEGGGPFVQSGLNNPGERAGNWKTFIEKQRLFFAEREGGGGGRDCLGIKRDVSTFPSRATPSLPTPCILSTRFIKRETLAAFSSIFNFPSRVRDKRCAASSFFPLSFRWPPLIFPRRDVSRDIPSYKFLTRRN